MSVRDLIPRAFRKNHVPVKYEHDDPFSLLRREMESIFDSFHREFQINTFFDREDHLFTPRIDVKENDKEIKVSAELPGMDEKDVEVLLERDSLTIKGEKKDEKEDRGDDYHRLERSYGTFSRTLHLPEEVEPEKITADFKKGVLTVHIPKTDKSKTESKKINVTVN